VTFPRYSLALALAVALPAQDTPPPAAQADPMVANFEKKLASDFLTKAPWVTEWDAAKAAAKKENKPILGYFTRSFAH
jgi:hypothetical protein